MTKIRNIVKHFRFSKVVTQDNIPAYIRQYVKNEQVLTTYRTSHDHGVFTNTKMVLFDNQQKTKQIYTIPYKSISITSVVFGKDTAELNLYMDSGYPISLKFVDMNGTDKLRLRILYTCIDKFVNNKEPIKEDIEKLINNTIKL